MEEKKFKPKKEKSPKKLFSPVKKKQKQLTTKYFFIEDIFSCKIHLCMIFMIFEILANS